MRWRALLYSALFAAPEDGVVLSDRLLAKKSDGLPAPNLGQHILYEYYMPIDAIVFLMGAYSPTRRELDYIVKSVLNTKKLILQDKKTVELITNLSSIVRGDSSVQAILNARNNVLKADKSFICANLVKKAQKDVLQRLGRMAGGRADAHPGSEEAGTRPFSIDQITDPGRDQEYQDMIYRLKQVIYENGPVGKQLRYEKEEFYRQYVDFPPPEIRRTKISLSLGGAIISPHTFAELIAAISIADKEELVRKWVGEIMAPIEDLELRTRTKALMEKKRIAKEFLESFLGTRRGELNSVLETRSRILELVLRDEEKIGLENWRQEKYIKDMIRVVENVKTDEWLVKYSRDVVEDYTVYLLTGQQEDKKRLLSHFK